MNICGFINGSKLFRIYIPIKKYHRLIELTQNDSAGIPDWMDGPVSTMTGYRAIMTAQPEWFDGDF